MTKPDHLHAAPWAWRPFSAVPDAFGLYDPRFEHDACGVSFVVDIKGVPSHDIVATALGALCNLDHRGASGAEANTGDGAGILLQVPDRFLRAVVDFDAAAGGRLRRRPRASCRRTPATADEADGRDRGDRRRARACGRSAGATCPSTPSMHRPDRAERRCRASASCSSPTRDGADAASSSTAARSCARKRIEHEIATAADGEPASTSRRCRAAPSSTRACSPRRSCAEFFPDLADERVESALALVHCRFSTNTFPSWPLAHPYRYIAHNGEINTVQGNRNWMRAREALLADDRSSRRPRAHLPDLHARARPTRPASTRCSSCCTSAAARLPHAVLMMIPEAWENHDVDGRRRSAPSTGSTPR